MATAIATPIEKGACMSKQEQLRPDLLKIVDDILGLKAMAATVGFQTYKSQRELLAPLSPEDLAAVGRELARREEAATKRTRPIYDRNK